MTTGTKVERDRGTWGKMVGSKDERSDQSKNNGLSWVAFTMERKQGRRAQTGKSGGNERAQRGRMESSKTGRTTYLHQRKRERSKDYAGEQDLGK